MINDMYCTYDNAQFQYNYPYSFDKANKCYLYNKQMPNVSWVYGDSVELNFNLAVINDLPNLSGKSFKFIVYNYRMENIYEFGRVEATLTPSFNIDVELSQTVFIPGVYFCELQLYTFDVDENEKEIITSMTTLIPPTKYICYVYM